MDARGFPVSLDQLQYEPPVADLAVIRSYNPQRYEMEQLTAVVYEDTQNHICVGYKDVTDKEFWVRGHMPGMPLMPGVIMCEAAAQLASYYTQRHDLLGSEMVGFGGLEAVRFRDPVFPGDRLFVATELLRARRGRMIVCQFWGMVEDRIVVSGKLKGIPLPTDALRTVAQRASHRQASSDSGDSEAGESS